ncbi:putative DNA primase small subunit [Neospora caninum Liverpool]|uniref:DNA primase n=1 Tax=Neospora caninum (strain Liverpool) TaxID=572307 RepID=F0VGK5_NEOCL|nr:putative DNA primase small subunit [Neospora caninum Liverpool]CBZ52849.1 putative DNA primase small subunit [Neospora caninum Liverpool]CEL66829.1 TPA: DNA primase small subunit, putative [Neospora caninum Liverpool]|eukprot:XP_003882881.1 putative DNA primase small subunit [Neospora caninum Liverpool]
MVQQADAPLPHDASVADKDLLFYYDKLFPFGELSKWLTYKNSPHLPESEANDPLFFAKREVCFTCRKPGGVDNADEFFLRWQSFRTVEEMKERLKDMSSLVCFKFDFGAVYSLPVSEKDSFHTAFKPEQKELVFDIDMNDYDDIRTCCTDKRVCQKCWAFLEVAMSLLDSALREDFGFENILWVYSGRRGVHCWVCDSSARLLPSDGRAQLCEYLNLCTGSDQQMKKVMLRGGRVQPYFVDRAFCLAYRRFQRLLEEQDFFASDSPHLPASGEFQDSTAPQFHYQKLLNYLPDFAAETSGSSRSWKGTAKSERREGARGAPAGASSGAFAVAKPHMSAWVKKRVSERRRFSSEELFNELCAVAGCPRPRDFSGDVEDVKQIPSFIKEIVLAYSYPRLDINVSKDIGHLLKSPFCIHHSTGRVCVPLDVESDAGRGSGTRQRFDPARVPTLTLLRRQFDDPARAHLPPHQRTSLAPYLDFFRDQFLHSLLKNVTEEMKYVKKLLEGVDARVKPEACF